MKKLYKILPVLTIASFTLFGIPWCTHPDILEARSDKAEQRLHQYLADHIIIGDDNKYYVSFARKRKMGEKTEEDIIKIRFSVNKITLVSPVDYNTPKFSWEVGYVEYYGNSTHMWIQLYDKFDTSKSFVIPVAMPGGRVSMKDDNPIISILPEKMMKAKNGGSISIIPPDKQST